VLAIHSSVPRHLDRLDLPPRWADSPGCLQPLKTVNGVSPSVGDGTVLTSLVVVTVLYGLLALIELGLMLRYARSSPPEAPGPGRPATTATRFRLLTGPDDL